MSACREEHLHFWVQGVARDGGRHSTLCGFYFECGDGPVARGPSPDAQCWAVSSAGKQAVTGKVEGVHVCNRGWELRLENGRIESLPCLVTTDPDVHCIFHDNVQIESNDPAVDVSWLIGDGIPVCGRGWFGVAMANAGKIRLIAFSDSGSLPLPCDAYYPDWGHSLDEEDSFRLRISRSSG